MKAIIITVSQRTTLASPPNCPGSPLLLLPRPCECQYFLRRFHILPYALLGEPQILVLVVLGVCFPSAHPLSPLPLPLESPLIRKLPPPLSLLRSSTLLIHSPPAISALSSSSVPLSPPPPTQPPSPVVSVSPLEAVAANIVDEPIIVV